MKRVGIVGNGNEKFTELGKQRALEVIRGLMGPDTNVVSGHSPLGGVDFWAEEEAARVGAKAMIFHPAVRKWDGEGKVGYKQRNLEIARYSDELHVVVVDDYPPEFAGKKYRECYHCFGRNGKHVKSGACWTALKFEEAHPGVQAVWHVVSNV